MSDTEPEVQTDGDADTERLENAIDDDTLPADDDEAPEPEPEPEPAEPFEENENPPPPHVTPEDIEKRYTKSVNAFQAYGRKLFAIHEGNSHDLFECPLCPEMHKGYLSIHDAGRVPDDIQAAVMQYMGLTRERDYAQLPGFETCETCGGEGKGATGSHVAGKTLATCPTCNGSGYNAPHVQAANGHIEHPPELSGPTVHGIDLPQPDVDVWNEPRILPDGRENPNYGKMPNMKVPVEPWGVTAGLNALDAA